MGVGEAYVLLGEGRKREMKAKCLLVADNVLRAGLRVRCECGVGVV